MSFGGNNKNLISLIFTVLLGEKSEETEEKETETKVNRRGTNITNKNPETRRILGYC